VPKAKAKAKVKGKKGKRGGDDEDEDDDEEEDAPKAKAKAKIKGKKGKRGGDEDDEEDEEDAPKAKAKAKGKKAADDEDEEADGKAPDTESEKPAEKPATGGGGKHSEYKVAKVLSAEAMKKKKGSLLVELATGGENVSVVTTFQNLEEGALVILAPEGSSVLGKEVKRVKVAGEWTAGVICGPMEMGLAGDASEAIILDSSHEVGSAAPAGGD